MRLIVAATSTGSCLEKKFQNDAICASISGHKGHEYYDPVSGQRRKNAPRVDTGSVLAVETQCLISQHDALIIRQSVFESQEKSVFLRNYLKRVWSAFGARLEPLKPNRSVFRASLERLELSCKWSN